MLQKYFERLHYSASYMCSVTQATRLHSLDPHEGDSIATLAAEPFRTVLVNTAADPTRDRSAQVIVRDRCATDADIKHTSANRLPYTSCRDVPNRAFETDHLAAFEVPSALAVADEARAGVHSGGTPLPAAG
jgi:hypothetical protein